MNVALSEWEMSFAGSKIEKKLSAENAHEWLSHLLKVKIGHANWHGWETTRVTTTLSTATLTTTTTLETTPN